MSKSQYKRFTAQGFTPGEAAEMIRSSAYQDGLQQGRIEGARDERKRVLHEIRNVLAFLEPTPESVTEAAKTVVLESEFED